MPRKDFYFLGFVIAMFFYMVATAITKHLELSHFDLGVEIFICACLSIIYPEPGSGLGWGWRSIRVMLLFTAFLCATWTAGFWLWTSHSSSFDWGWKIVFPLLGLVVVTPWFEEKIVRHLLLYSVAEWIGPIASSVIVSILFAIAHKSVMVMAFIVSLALCWMRFRFKAKTAHCVVVHGLINAYVLLLYML